MSRDTRTALVTLAGGVALGVAMTVGTARLVYAGGGFLGATGVLVALTLAALGAGLWGGDPALSARVSPRLRVLALAAALAAGALFAAFWRGAVQEGAMSGAGALAAMLLLAAPGYMAGSLFASIGTRGPAIAPLALAGAAIGVLFAANAFVPLLQPWSALLLIAGLVAAVSPLAPAAVALQPSEDGMDGLAIVVTGVGDRGQLGFAIAERLRAAGARLVITARDAAIHERAELLGGEDEVVGVEADLARDDGAARVIDAAQQRFGRLDGLVNVAGGLRVIDTIEATTPEAWNEEYRRNVETALRMTRAALPLLRASRGAVVSFTSPAALSAPASLGAYSAAKAGVIALTQALAIEESRHGVRANAIAPGLVDTDQNRGDAPPGQRFVTRQQVADTVVWLLSRAGAGVNGEVVRVRGATIGTD